MSDRIVISELPPGAHAGDVIQLLGRMGRVRSCDVNDRNLTAVVTLSSPNEAATIVQHFQHNHPIIDRRVVRVALDNAPAPSPYGSSSDRSPYGPSNSRGPSFRGGGGGGYGQDHRNRRDGPDRLPSGSPNRILMLHIRNYTAEVTLENIHTICSKFGKVDKIVFCRQRNTAPGRNAEPRILVEFAEQSDALKAMEALQGKNIFTGCCQLHIIFSTQTALQVRRNSDTSWDYTAPSRSQQRSRSPPRRPRGRSRSRSRDRRDSYDRDRRYGDSRRDSYDHRRRDSYGDRRRDSGYDRRYDRRDDRYEDRPRVAHISNVHPIFQHPDMLFRIMGVYGDVRRVKFQYSNQSVAFVEYENGGTRDAGRRARPVVGGPGVYPAVHYMSDVRYDTSMVVELLRLRADLVRMRENLRAVVGGNAPTAYLAVSGDAASRILDMLPTPSPDSGIPAAVRNADRLDALEGNFTLGVQVSKHSSVVIPRTMDQKGKDLTRQYSSSDGAHRFPNRQLAQSSTRNIMSPKRVLFLWELPAERPDRALCLHLLALGGGATGDAGFGSEMAELRAYLTSAAQGDTPAYPSTGVAELSSLIERLDHIDRFVKVRAVPGKTNFLLAVCPSACLATFILATRHWCSFNGKNVGLTYSRQNPASVEQGVTKLREQFSRPTGGSPMHHRAGVASASAHRSRSRPPLSETVAVERKEPAKTEGTVVPAGSPGMTASADMFPGPSLNTVPPLNDAPAPPEVAASSEQPAASDIPQEGAAGSEGLAENAPEDVRNGDASPQNAVPVQEADANAS